MADELTCDDYVFCKGYGVGRVTYIYDYISRADIEGEKAFEQGVLRSSDPDWYYQLVIKEMEDCYLPTVRELSDEYCDIFEHSGYIESESTFFMCLPSLSK